MSLECRDNEGPLECRDNERHSLKELDLWSQKSIYWLCELG